MNEQILKKLSIITNEEQAILSGEADIDRSLYTTDINSDIIQGKRLLDYNRIITIRPHTRFVHFPKHSHDYVEVVYMCDGTTTHIVNGVTITLKKGELLFLSQNVEHEVLPARESDIAVNFIILPQFFNTTVSMLGESESPLKAFVIDCLNDGKNKSGYLHFMVSDVLPIQNLIENLLYALISDTQTSQVTNQSTMGLLFLNLLEHTDKLAYSENVDAIVIQVMSYIEANYKSGSLQELANSLHYDFYWLSREIKRQTGKTYTQILQEKRLNQSAFLLANTDMKIYDISESVGYENISYFHRIFTDKYGVSPKKYRDRQNTSQ